MTTHPWTHTSARQYWKKLLLNRIANYPKPKIQKKPVVNSEKKQKTKSTEGRWELKSSFPAILLSASAFAFALIGTGWIAIWLYALLLAIAIDLGVSTLSYYLGQRDNIKLNQLSLSIYFMAIYWGLW